ncbi:MAG: protein kinase, partial [Promethearchaeota archaeon]
MSPYEERWPRVEEALLQLGVREIWRIRNIRKKFNEITSLGTPLMPDFTLHNITHSDNLILILGLLQKKFGFTLDRYEAYLLAASAYLHDLGMFFSEMRFQNEILPDLSKQLRFCPKECCDHIGDYPLQGKDIGIQIRSTHHLLSAYRLLKNPPSIFGIEEDDRSYLITLCRGHRKVDLREQGCDCYQTKPLSGELLRLALLAALLRISDALDFYENRAPAPVFQLRVLDFLRNPIALEHWLKHYFVTDPYITRRDESGNISLECTVNFTVPMKQINGRSYLDFFTPLFEKHVAAANATDLDIRQYPPDLTNALNIVNMKVTLGRPDERAGFRDLPVEIIERIEQSQCENVMKFLEWLSRLEEDSKRIRSSKSLVEIVLGGNLSDFASEKQSAIVGNLADILNISRDQIRILRKRGGSIILQIEMPTEAVNRLIALYEANDPMLKGLDFQQVKKILFGKYKILELLGSGAVGDVYLAEDMDLKRKVAVKHLKSEYAADEEALERFREEARTIASLRHPNIAIVHGLEQENGQSCVIMEYAEKGTLADFLAREGPLPITQAIDLAIALCRALVDVHRRGIFHQDIKPGNILLIESEDKIVSRLSDFGLSGVPKSDIYSRLQYASPEQLRGESVDARSDIYSLGMVLYEMLTGRPPFAGTVEEVHRAQLEQEPLLPSSARRGIPPLLERVVLKALSKEPEDRYQTAREMAENLEIARQEELKKEKQIHNFYTQAKQYVSSKDWLKAVEMLQVVLALDPNYEDTAKLLEEVQTQISPRLQLLYDQASALFAEENWQEAVEKFQEILALDPQYKDAASKAEETEKQARLQTLYTEGIEFGNNGEWERAINRFGKIHRLNPDYKAVDVKLAEARRKKRLQDFYDEYLPWLEREDQRSPKPTQYPGAKAARIIVVGVVTVLLATLCVLLSGDATREILRHLPGMSVSPSPVASTPTVTSTSTLTFTPFSTATSTPPVSPTTTPVSPTAIPTPPTPTNTPTPPIPTTIIPIATLTATHTPTGTPTSTATSTPTNTPTPTLTATAQLTGPITLTIYLRDTLTEAGSVALDQPNGGMIYEEGKFVHGHAAVQIGEMTYPLDEEAGPGEPEQLPDHWRVEFEFADALVARTGNQAGFNP